MHLDEAKVDDLWRDMQLVGRSSEDWHQIYQDMTYRLRSDLQKVRKQCFHPVVG